MLKTVTGQEGGRSIATFASLSSEAPNPHIARRRTIIWLFMNNFNSLWPK